MWTMAAALALGLWGDVASLPPGMAPMPQVNPERVVHTLDSVLKELGPVQYAPAPRGVAPVPGSATESEALRRYVRAQVRRQESQPVRAAEDLDAALRLDPASVALHRARAEAAVDAGDIPRAISEWEAVLALEPGDRHAAMAVGIAALETGQYERTVSLLGPVWQHAGGNAGNRADAGHAANAGHAATASASPALNESARFALGSVLARALLRMGYDDAALAPAQYALQTDPVRVASERGDGIDAAVRAAAALGRDTGEAALRLGQWDAATTLLAHSVALVPDVRAQSSAALAAFRAGKPLQARAVLDQLLARGMPASETHTLLALWILRTLGGDDAVAERVRVLGQYSIDDGRVARLLAAADPARAAQFLDDAVAQGAVDRATLRAAFESMSPRDAAALAMRTLRTDPALTRTAARELVRAVKSAGELRAILVGAPETAEREALRSAIASYQRDSGTAWSLAEAARESWPEEPVALFALVEAATAAADPALVQRACVDASGLVQSDPNWHAAVARAAAATGLDELKSASMARWSSLDPRGFEAERVRAGSLGSAPSWSARGRAEQAIARGELQEAAAALMEARALDPDDDAALGMLLRVLPRTIGPRATLDWARAAIDEVPNDPLLWEVFAIQSVTAGRSAAALTVIDTRLAGDPDDTAVLAAREALLRATGQTEAALVSARARAASLPPGARRALEQATIEAQGGDAASAIDALKSFADSAYPPPLGMRAAALDVLRRLPVSAERASVMRRIARDAILADGSAPLEFFAFEALSAASDPSLNAVEREEAAAMIAQEAAAAPLHRSAQAVEGWRAACDFLAAQGYAREAAEFIRARLAEPEDLGDADLTLLARAAFASDALAGKGSRSLQALQLLNSLQAQGRVALPVAPPRTSSGYTELASIFTIVGDRAGADQILEAACATDADDAVAMNNLAYSRAEAGILDERTFELARKAALAHPGEPAHMDTYGWVLYLRGDVADTSAGAGALTYLQKAVAHKDKSAGPEVHLHLGDAQWRSGDRKSAESSWKTALDRVTELDKERTVGLYRDLLRRQTGLGAVDAERFYGEHDASVATRARARLSAVEAGTEPPVTPMLGASAVQRGATK